MSDHGDELKLRLNVKFKSGTAPALLAELSSLPERRRVKRLLDLAQIGLLYEQTGRRLPASSVIEQPVEKSLGDLDREPLKARSLDSTPVSGLTKEAEPLLPKASAGVSEGRVTARTSGEPQSPAPLARKRPGFNTTMTG